MKQKCNTYILFLLLFTAVGCKTTSEEAKKEDLANLTSSKVIGEGEWEIPVVDFNGLKPLLEKDDAATYVVNFWATWCAPCVKELPYFEQLHSEMEAQGVKVILVNLDMPAMWESHLLPFIKKKNLQSQIIVLDDPDQNRWITEVNEDWSGAIPATLIYNSKTRLFYEKPFEKEELFKTIYNFLNPKV